MMLYRTKNNRVIEMLTSKDLINLLQAANSLRNDGAHGGVSSERDIELKHRKLLELITSCRRFMGNNWKRYQLVQPGQCRYAGGVFTYQAKRLMGTRTPFETIEQTTVEGMEDGRLHLLATDEGRALELMPFIRVMPSPKTEANACYYFNRMEGDQQRYVSYHFESESEFEAVFDDTKAAIASLRGDL
jgi:hypothetical protein